MSKQKSNEKSSESTQSEKKDKANVVERPDESNQPPVDEKFIADAEFDKIFQGKLNNLSLRFMKSVKNNFVIY